MCAKKNLSAKDLSEKFGFKISEKDWSRKSTRIAVF